MYVHTYLHSYMRTYIIFILSRAYYKITIITVHTHINTCTLTYLQVVLSFMYSESSRLTEAFTTHFTLIRLLFCVDKSTL